MPDKELLKQWFDFFVSLKIMEGDRESVMDMVARYKNPPLTMLRRYAMLMTRADYDKLETLLERTLEAVKPVELGGNVASEPEITVVQ